MTEDIGEISRAITTVTSSLRELVSRRDLVLAEPPEALQKITTTLHDKECRKTHMGSSYGICRFNTELDWTGDDRKRWLIAATDRIGRSGKTLEGFADAVRTVYPDPD